MATTELTETTVNYLANAFDDLVNSGAAQTLVFETAADDAVATITLNATAAFGDAVAGVLTLESSTPDADTAAGTVEHASLYEDAVKLAEFDCTATGGGGSITMADLDFLEHDTLTMGAFTVTVETGP
jgi:hypothetical protein